MIRARLRGGDREGLAAADAWRAGRATSPALRCSAAADAPPRSPPRSRTPPSTLTSPQATVAVSSHRSVVHGCGRVAAQAHRRTPSIAAERQGALADAQYANTR